MLFLKFYVIILLENQKEESLMSDKKTYTGHAAALLNEDYDQFISRIGRAPAPSFYPFDVTEDYIDYIEVMGHGRIKVNYEKLYRMEEEF